MSVQKRSIPSKADDLHRLLPGSLRLEVRSLEDQVYSMEDTDGTTYYWNATEGRRLAERAGAVLDFCPADFGIDLAHIRERYHNLNEAYALFTDLSEPLLFVPFTGQGSDRPTAHLIDGWHRLFKAVATGVEVLPAYLLTQEQADNILLGKVSPVTSRTCPNSGSKW
jgi:hypothetical protein